MNIKFISDDPGDGNNFGDLGYKKNYITKIGTPSRKCEPNSTPSALGQMANI
jgi:hypothetical protein